MAHATPPASSPILPRPIDTSGFGGHPRGLNNLFFTELWERFSFYGMRALLTLFMVAPIANGGLGFAAPSAAAIYGNYTMSVYLLSILGGFIADNFIGSKRAVLWGGIIIATGHYALAFESHATFFAGLVLISIGTGLLKPNISSMVGGLYAPEDERRDAGFSIFYMGINLGALVSPLITGWLAQSSEFREILSLVGFNPLHSWHWGFAAAGVGMTIGLIVYVAQLHRLDHVGNAPSRNSPRPWGRLGLVALGSLTLIGFMTLADKETWTHLADFIREHTQFGAASVWINQHPHLDKKVVYFLAAVQVLAVLAFALRRSVESRRIAAILVFFIAAELFWAIFEQAGSTIALFSDSLTDNRILGWVFPSSWYQSINSLFVIALAPVFAWLWIRLGPKQPSSPLKFSLGLAFLGLSFVLMVPAAKLTADGKISPLWLVGLFFLQTVGEMCLSPVGLSTMTKLAPPRLVGLVMGIWFLATALGNKMAGVLASDFTSNDPQHLSAFFWQQALVVGAFTLALVALIPWIKKLMSGVR